MIPHPDEAPVKALMYELFAEHQRKGPVVRAINGRGYRARRGKEFAIQTIQHMLRSGGNGLASLQLHLGGKSRGER